MGLNFQAGVRVGFELLGHGERHGQEDGFLKTIVGQAACFEFEGQRPLNLTRGDARG